ncbi:MAG: tetratricopeptide repeat protein [Deltaproteobacteria bacterium]|nr:tetratricopeptide repeat protein [Deltaproteobacteria bacterium]
MVTRTDQPPVRVLEPADLWAHGAAAMGTVAALLTGPLLHAPALAGRLGLSLAAAGTIHAAAAAIAGAGAALHLTRVCLAWLGGHETVGLLPSRADLRELLDALAFGAYLRPSPPVWGRYSYREKVPYLAFGLGLPLSFATGYAVGFPEATVGLFGPRMLLTLASVHEAVGLVLVPFLLWHLFFAQLQPGALFWNSAWLTGREPWSRVVRTRPGWAASLTAAPEVGPAEPEAVAEALSVEHFLSEGNRAARDGRYDEAEAAYREALSLYPGYSQALFNLGVACARGGKPDRAREALTRFLEQDPFNPVAPKARQILEEIGGSDHA